MGGKGNTVIDYVMGDGLVEEKVERIRIRDKVDSDSLSDRSVDKGGGRREGGKEGRRERQKGSMG